jgi:hypothetical protein
MKRVFRIALVFCMVAGICNFAFGQTAEAKIGNEKIAGTWALQSGDTIILIIFSQKGQGREVVINQSSVKVMPFEYTLTAATIQQVATVEGRKIPMPMQYEMPAPNRLKLLEYVEGVSPTFQKLNSNGVEGIWKRTGVSEEIEYIFAVAFLVKTQNNQPFAFGTLEVSGSTLTLIEQSRHLVFGDTDMWIQSTVPKESVQYKLNGDTLSWTSGSEQYVFTRQ